MEIRNTKLKQLLNLLLGGLPVAIVLLLLGIFTNNTETPKTEETPPQPEQVPDEEPMSAVFVDLGLSVLWAECNLGANSPEEYGDYYAWGMTSTKDRFIPTNSTIYGKTLEGLKSAGIVDADGNLTADYDVAQKLGKGRVPTWKEIQELQEKCTWTWTTQNGVNGYKVMGPNGNSIFLPASGYRFGGDRNDVDSVGKYWSSTANVDDRCCPRGLLFRSVDYTRLACFEHRFGLPVRPVMASKSSAPAQPEKTPAKTSKQKNTSTQTQTITVNTNASVTVTSSQNGFADLGLSVKWAMCNLGAGSPEQYGNYYAWGETSTKSNYTEGNSTTFGMRLEYLKNSGIVDVDSNLTANYDAAQKLGKGRIPTLAEIKELKKNCMWKWAKMNGVKGYKITGPNGNSIFLPAAGFRLGTGSNEVGSEGYYWTSTPYDNINGGSDRLYFYSGSYEWLSGSRHYGFPIRPVKD